VNPAQNNPQQSKFNQYLSNGPVPNLFRTTVATATGGVDAAADVDADDGLVFVS